MNLLGVEIRSQPVITPLVTRSVALRMRAAPKALSPVYPQGGGGWRPWMIREPFSGAWQRNQEWSLNTVLAHAAVYACITRIAQDFGKLRPKLVEKDEDGIWSEVTNAAHSPVLRRPNRFQNHIQFKEWWVTSKLVHGNAYALLERDGRGVVSAMYLLDPTRVQVLVADDGAVFYGLKKDNLTGLEEDDVKVPASEIIHDRINCLYHPLIGTSPIYACGAAANMGLKIQNSSATFFGNGSLMSGVLSAAQDINAQKSEELSALWNARFGPNGQGGVAVLGSGMKYEKMQMTATDSQLIEQLQWTAETVCSTFHVPPWKIGIGSQPAYTKPEIANQAYYSDCLQSPIEQWELCMDQGLGIGEGVGIEGRELGIELDLDGLLRMDVASQVTTLTAGIGGGLYTPNEAREKVDLEPLEGGDTIYLQQQQYGIQALAERDADKPFSKPTPSSAGTPATPPGGTQDQLPAGDPVSEEDATRGWEELFTRDALALAQESLALTGT